MIYGYLYVKRYHKKEHNSKQYVNINIIVLLIHFRMLAFFSCWKHWQHCWQHRKPVIKWNHTSLSKDLYRMYVIVIHHYRNVPHSNSFSSIEVAANNDRREGNNATNVSQTWLIYNNESNRERARAKQLWFATSELRQVYSTNKT